VKRINIDSDMGADDAVAVMMALLLRDNNLIRR
jgi:inosine-uridine nucleoside N-ribohydrolase